MGMGTDFVSGDRDWIERVNARLDFDLLDLLREGPEDRLERTRYTQPALFVVNHLILRYLRSRGLEADLYAGHSLGEYNALVAGGWAEFDDLLPVVVRRGLSMDRAARSTEGGMSAVLKLDPAVLENICEEISEDDSISGTVEVSLLNTPLQVVVSGALPALDVLEERARDAGALKVVSLDVSGPWHSRYMEPAQEPLREALEQVRWKPGEPVYSNVQAVPVTSVEEVESGLLDQLVRPVRWEETIRNLRDRSTDEFIELGPGKVLHGMTDRIVSDDEILNRYTDTLDHINEWLEELECRN